MKPICVSCRRFFRAKKIGYYFIEGMPKGNDAPPGNAEPEKWSPYKLWVGDLWECEGCFDQIVVGTGLHPIAEHYQAGFAERIKTLGADFQVNDC